MTIGDLSQDVDAIRAADDFVVKGRHVLIGWKPMRAAWCQVAGCNAFVVGLWSLGDADDAFLIWLCVAHGDDASNKRGLYLYPPC